MKKNRKRLAKHRKKPQVLCTNTNCSYIWEPKPKLWKRGLTFNNGNPAKVVFCPVCNTRVRLEKEDLAVILKAWGMIDE